MQNKRLLFFPTHSETFEFQKLTFIILSFLPLKYFELNMESDKFLKNGPTQNIILRRNEFMPKPGAAWKIEMFSKIIFRVHSRC